MFVSTIFQKKMWSSCISYQMETVQSLRYLSENLSSKMTLFLVSFPGCPVMTQRDLFNQTVQLSLKSESEE